MLERKNVVTGVVAIIVTLAGLLGYQKLNVNQSQGVVSDNQAAQQEQALSDLQTRISQLQILREEQVLTRDIMLLQQEIRELNLKAPPPVSAPPVPQG